MALDRDWSDLVATSTLANLSLPVPSEVEGGVVVRACTPAGERLLSQRGRSVITIGAFDGVHLGHRRLVADARAQAASLGCPLAAVTFDPDPDAVLAPPQLNQCLLTCDDRLRLLASLGCDLLVSVTFDEEMATTSYEDFVRGLLVPLLHPVALHVGNDFAMGAGGRGTVGALRGLCSELGISVSGHDLVTSAGLPVTATRVRGLLDEGDVTSAADLLGRSHFVRGKVVHGRGEGTSFGFPTANVSCALSAKLPATGVYGGFVRDGESAWPCAMNVGAPPTFAQPRPAFLEANLLGFEGDLYGREVEVVFFERLRASHRFDSTDGLERAVRANIEWVRENVGERMVEVCS